MPEDVQILSKNRINQPLANGEIAVFFEYQYSALGLPVRRVTIPASDDTPEQLAVLIKADLANARVAEPTRLTLPD